MQQFGSLLSVELESDFVYWLKAFSSKYPPLKCCSAAPVPGAQCKTLEKFYIQCLAFIWWLLRLDLFCPQSYTPHLSFPYEAELGRTSSAEEPLPFPACGNADWTFLLATLVKICSRSNSHSSSINGYSWRSGNAWGHLTKLAFPEVF